MTDLVTQLHASPWSGVFYMTGGGASLLSQLLGVGGASATVLEASVPYSEQSLAELLGGAPDQAASNATARALAMRAFQRATELGAKTPFGFACTASLATNRTKRGRHRAHLAVQTQQETCTLELGLSGDRASEERELTRQALAFLTATLDIHADEPEGAQCVPGQPAWRDLLAGHTSAVVDGEHAGTLVFPGSFNPLHEGHRTMMAIAEARTGAAGAFEISIENPDKPMLDYHAIEQRMGQFERPVWLTRLPTFVEKSRQFPGAVFIIGSDTLVRIADARYYVSSHARDAALAEIANNRIRFLAFGRSRDGVFEHLDALNLPEPLLSLCEEVPQSEFHIDIASRDLRKGG